MLILPIFEFRVVHDLVDKWFHVVIALGPFLAKGNLAWVSTRDSFPRIKEREGEKRNTGRKKNREELPHRHELLTERIGES